MSLISPLLPSADDELDVLEPLAPLLFEGLERATEEACQFFEVKDKPINASLYPNLVRYHMREYLRDKGQVVSDFDREDMNNNGLSLTFRGRRYRIWKAEDDKLPPPGSSQAKKAFLNQQLTMIFPDEGEPRAVELNLVVLWNVDAHHRLCALHLVCPRWASNDGLTAEAHWAEPIKHPAIAPATPTARSASENDLPIEVQQPDASDAEQAQ